MNIISYHIKCFYTTKFVFITFRSLKLASEAVRFYQQLDSPHRGGDASLCQTASLATDQGNIWIWIEISTAVKH